MRVPPYAKVIGAVFAGLIVCSIYIVVADRWCPLEEPKSLSIGDLQVYHRPQNENQTSDQHDNQGAGQKSGSTLSVFAPLQTHAEQTPTQAQSDNQKHQPRKWVTIVCDVKVGDIVIAFLTYCLVLVTGWLVRATIGLQDVTRLLAEHVPVVERAYVSGGGYFPTEVRNRGRKERSERFLLTVDNYGKTPAYVTHVKIGFLKLDGGALPNPPPYDSCRDYTLSAVVPPGKEGLKTDIRLHLSEIGGDIIFGRFFYEDIFANRIRQQETKIRSSGFILQITANRITLPIDAPRAYTEWD